MVEKAGPPRGTAHSERPSSRWTRDPKYNSYQPEPVGRAEQGTRSGASVSVRDERFAIRMSGRRQSRTLTVGLLWHSVNSGNLGIGALTASQIAIARAAASRAGVKLRFLVIGWKDHGLPYIVGSDIAAAGIRQRDILRPRTGLSAIVRKTDVVFDVGAGDSFADLYGPRRAAMQLLAKFVVLHTGRPLVLSPQTIGPFERKWARAGALFILSRARAVFTRDQPSCEFLSELGFQGAVTQASDLALRLPYEQPKTRSPDGTVRVGLNISGLLFNGGYNRANMFNLRDDYCQSVRELVAALSGDEARAAVGGRRMELHFVSHVISQRQVLEDDARVAESFVAAVPGAVAAPRFASPSEAKSYIASLDFFIGSRMHACIAAFSSGVPVIPLAYSRKFAGMFGSLGYDAVVDCRTVGSAEIVSAVLNQLRSREVLAAQAAASLKRGLTHLNSYENFVAELFQELAEQKEHGYANGK